jgi:hypothetical protein
MKPRWFAGRSAGRGFLPRGCLLVGLLGIAGAGRAAEPAASVTFGLRLRAAPTALAEVHAPVVVTGAPTNEASLVRRADGSLELYSVAKPASDAVQVLRSRDGGLTWSDPSVAFPLPARAYYALQVLEAADGAMHAVVHLQGEGPGGYRGRLYEVYHLCRPVGADAWSTPVRVVPGYVGSIRGFIQLRSGRLLLAVGRAVPEREKASSSGPDLGWNDTRVYLSDDQGGSWRQSPDVLSLELSGRGVTRYGAIEPVLLELSGGRVWMLVRDRGGRLWQSVSVDGARWPALVRGDLLSSDSPAACLRLRDGRIVLLTNGCQNWSDPRSYAAGGREVLHAAISADEGTTWRGFREVLQDTPTEAKGDRGTAYPTLVENNAGKVVLVSGQGEGKRALVMFDPAWVQATELRDDLAIGPVNWTAFGGVDLLARGPAEERVLRLSAPAATGAGACWNFPLAAAGEIQFRVQSGPGLAGARFSFTDHFNRGDDRKAAEHAVFSVEAKQLGLASGAAGTWSTVTVTWDSTHATAHIAESGATIPIQALRAPLRGLNYLRIDLPAAATLELSSLRMAATP